MTLAVTVHSKTNPTGAAIRTLSADHARSVLRRRNEPGGLTLTIPANHADAAFLEPYHWLRFTLDGDVIIAGRLSGDDDMTPIDPGEEGGEIVQVKAPGALATLADAKVYRPGWFADRRADTRWFGPMSPEYQGYLSWSDPAFAVRQDYSLSPYGVLNPEGWHAGEAEWIWPTAFNGAASPPQAVGKALFAATGVLTEEGDQLFEITADDGYRLWVDGIIVGERIEAYGWTRTDRWPIFLTADTHYFFIEGLNIDRPSSPATNGAAVLFAWFSLVGGGEYGDLVGYSSSSWKALGYPSTAVGMTAGDILIRLLEEAQFRGALLHWSWDFTDTLDSNGDPWDRELSIGFKIGLSYLDVIRQLAAHAIDVQVDYATLTLRAFNKGTLNSNPSVELEEGVHIRRLVPQRTPALATDANVRTSDDTWQERSSGVADTSDGHPPRIEAYIELGSAQALDVVDQTDPVLDAFSQPKDTTAIEIISLSGEKPFDDFTEFDTITAPNRRLDPVDSDVIAIALSEMPPAADGAVGGTQLFTIEVEQVAT